MRRVHGRVLPGRPKAKPVKYFFAYQATTSTRGELVFGNIDVTISRPIDSYGDVEAVAKKIHADNPDTETVVILNWRRYEEHE